MDILKKKIKKIETCREISAICRLLIIVDAVIGIITRYEFYIFFILGCAFFILGIIFETKKDKKITELESEYMQVELKGDYFMLVSLLAPKIIFLQGPSSEGRIAIIVILKEDIVKVLEMSKEGAAKIFNITT